MIAPIDERQRLIVYIRANLRRYASRTGDKADKQFILDLQEMLEKYDLKNEENQGGKNNGN